MSVGSDDFNLDSQTLKGFLLLAWRVVMLLGLLGVAFQAGSERAKISEKIEQTEKLLYNLQDISPRVKTLEDWKAGIMVLAESRDVRIRNLENAGVGREVRLDGVENRVKNLEHLFENMKRTESKPLINKKVVER